MTQALGVPKWGTGMTHSQRTLRATCALGCPAPRHHVGAGVCSALRRNPSATCVLDLSAHRYQPKHHVCVGDARH